MIDANIMVSAALGLRTRGIIDAVGRARVLAISGEGAQEAIGTVRKFAAGREAMGVLEAYLSAINVASRDRYAGHLPDAAGVLRLAVASRNGSEADAHVLALAWALDADIWSHDRDFAGTGWPSWSSANLTARLRAEPGAAAL